MIDRYQAILTRRSSARDGAEGPAQEHRMLPEFVASSRDNAVDWVNGYIATHDLAAEYFFDSLNNLGPA